MNTADVDFAHALADFKDPFKSNLMTDFNVFCFKDSWSHQWRYRGSIEYENGNTQGKQMFKASSLSSLLKKMHMFTENLDSK